MKTSLPTRETQGLCQIPPLHILSGTILAVRAVKYTLICPVCNVQPVISCYTRDVLIQDTSSNVVHKGHTQNRITWP